MLPIFSEYWNPNIGRSRVFLEELMSFFMDEEYLRDLAIHGPFILEVFLGFYSCDGGNVHAFPFASFLAFTDGLIICNLKGRFPLGELSRSLFPLHVFDQPNPFNMCFHDILQLDAIVDVMAVTFVKVELHRLISSMYFSDGVRGLDSTFPEFCVCVDLVDLLPRNS